MTADHSSSNQLIPRIRLNEHVVVFRDGQDPSNGGVIGRHGRVVACDYKDNFYAVALSHPDQIVHRHFHEILRVENAEERGQLDENEIVFDSEIDPQTIEITGAMRLRTGHWVAFGVRKIDLPNPSARLRIPTTPQNPSYARIDMAIPKDLPLSREFIRRLLFHFLAIQENESLPPS